MERARIGTIERLKGLDRSLKSRVWRVRHRLLPILQITLATGFAYFIATQIFDHRQAFFAPISAIIILGLTGGDRIPRAVELTIGCTLGIGVGDFLFYNLGTGYLQLSAAVLISLLLASFLSKSPLISNQVAIGSILIATIMPPQPGLAGASRMIDALIGCSVGLLAAAIIPTHPLSSGRREFSKVLGLASSVLDDVSDALRNRDHQALNEALEAVRGSQDAINAMLAAAKTGREASTLSPFMWGQKRRVRTLERILTPVDNTIRNVRVLARRALVLCEDGDTVSEGQIQAIEELADITHALSEIYERSQEIDEAQEIPELVRRLRVLGAKVGLDLVEGKVLSASVVLAQTRSIVVDLLQVCGMSRESAVAVLVPTSETPAYPPEIWADDSSPTRSLKDLK